MSGLTDLAMLFKEREQRKQLGIVTGRVIKGFPDIEIRIDEHIVLNKDKLLFANHLMEGYERNIKFSDTNCGTTSSVSVGDHGSHSHTVASINVETTMQFTDTLKVNDLVIVIPTANEQKFYIIDKVVTV